MNKNLWALTTPMTEEERDTYSDLYELDRFIMFLTEQRDYNEVSLADIEFSGQYISTPLEEYKDQQKICYKYELLIHYLEEQRDVKLYQYRMGIKQLRVRVEPGTTGKQVVFPFADDVDNLVLATDDTDTLRENLYTQPLKISDDFTLKFTNAVSGWTIVPT